MIPGATDRELSMPHLQKQQDYWRRTCASRRCSPSGSSSPSLPAGNARELNSISFFGPLGFYMGAQGALLVYLLIIWVYGRYMNALDKEYGLDDKDEQHGKPAVSDRCPGCALVEVAGLCLLGQGMLSVLAGRTRDKNPIYRIFRVITDPVVQALRLVVPKAIGDQPLTVIAFLLLFALWIGLAYWRRQLCLAFGPGC